MANTVAAGAILALLGVPVAPLEALLRERFGEKGTAVVSTNLAAAQAGYDSVPSAKGRTRLAPRGERFLLLSGHDAIPLAAAAAGCRFMAAYPMSPSTGIITAFAADETLGVLVEQAEDEIAAINMAIGASFAGARAMTATSGGGFALMTEAVSLAGMTETPVVIVIAQRPGPATGLPTRTAQEDLLFAVHAGHGEFAKAVLAPSDPQDAYDKTVRAFDLAERFQIPVIVLTDQFLADSRFSLARLDTSAQSKPALADPQAFEDNTYSRYRLEPRDGGVSPRLVPGQSRHLVRADSDEHTEQGHITEDLVGVRPAMVAKRIEKLSALRREMGAPIRDRTEDADTVLVGWGSTYGALREATDRLRGEGRRIGHLHFTELWPLPELALPADCRYIAIEGNATGQLRRLLQAETGLFISQTISRSDGLPIEAADIIRGVGSHA
ncbi:2-oxoacid:acceptor oxidoreductase subunit alpha [Candidatus Bipolaricaulota bacterium]|nr:2-oxoacid:acceptor oxidoreductase subunit alpha [Candidatus Bipolaricaulota bacterium]